MLIRVLALSPDAKVFVRIQVREDCTRTLGYEMLWVICLSWGGEIGAAGEDGGGL